MSETFAKQLTIRQYALRRFLWDHRTEWVSSKQIFAGVYGYEAEATAYKQINEDVHAINDSGVFDKIIITSRGKGYKLATEAEFKDWSRRAYAECIKKIVYVCGLINAAKMDGQGIIPGLTGYQREFYDRFVKEEQSQCKNNDSNSL